MNKEQLEETINSMCDSYHNYLTADNIKESEMYYKSYADYREIIIRHSEEQAKQAELVDDMMRLVRYHKEKQKEAENENEPYRHQNKRYREALKQIEENTDGSVRNTARKALEDSE